MSDKNNKVFQKLKKQNGEDFAKAIRLEVPIALEDERILRIVRHAGRDASVVKNISKIIHSLLASDHGEKKQVAKCPLELLKEAGYDAYIVTDKKSQDAISKYFASGESLCTFGSDRWKNYKIINAVKTNVDDIKRYDFKNPERQDEYGTSVISIQCRDGFISIKNRYNHAVPNCDATFGNNPDSIIDGLKNAIEQKFGISLKGTSSNVPDWFMLADGQLVKYEQEINGIYYGDHAVVSNGTVHEFTNGNEFLYSYFIFDMKTKTLRLFDKTITDSFPDDFNRDYGGLQSLRVDKSGNLCDGDVVLFGVC